MEKRCKLCGAETNAYWVCILVRVNNVWEGHIAIDWNLGMSHRVCKRCAKKTLKRCLKKLEGVHGGLTFAETCKSMLNENLVIWYDKQDHDSVYSTHVN